MRRTLFEEDAENVEAARDVANSLSSLSRAQLQFGETDAARSSLKEATELRESCVQKVPANLELKRDVAVSDEALARVELSANNLDDGLEWLNKSVELRESLAAIDPNNVQSQRDLAVSLNLIGNVTCGMGDANSALEQFRRALTICQSIASDESPRSLKEVCQNWIGIAGCYETTEQYQEARDAFVEARRAIESLGEQAGDLTKFLDERIESCTKRLADTEK